MFNHKVLYNVIVFLADKSISLIQLCKNNTLCKKNTKEHVLLIKIQYKTLNTTCILNIFVILL